MKLNQINLHLLLTIYKGYYLSSATTARAIIKRKEKKILVAASDSKAFLSKSEGRRFSCLLKLVIMVSEVILRSSRCFSYILVPLHLSLIHFVLSKNASLALILTCFPYYSYSSFSKKSLITLVLFIHSSKPKVCVIGII